MTILDRIKSFFKQAKAKVELTKPVAKLTEKKPREAPEITTSIIKTDAMSLQEIQLVEQLYSGAGLGPVVDAGLKDYDKCLQLENKLINKVLGPQGSDIKGYGDAVAKRVSLAIYTLLNKQYGGKVGDLRSYLMALEEERDRANTRYDELMGRVVGILGDDYKELRTDSKASMEKLTEIIGEGVKDSRIDRVALLEKLADIDGLRSQIAERDAKIGALDSQLANLAEEKERLTQNYELQIVERDAKIGALDSQLADLAEEKERLTQGYESQIAERDLKIGALDSEKAALGSELEELKTNYKQLQTAVKALPSAVPYEEIRNKLGGELHAFLLKDSKVPNMVIDGVGRFIDFRKYLGVAAEKGAREASKHVEKNLNEVVENSSFPGIAR